jgi:hypothetical protein
VKTRQSSQNAGLMSLRALPFVLIISACSAVGDAPGGDGAPDSGLPVATTVELDVFSGRPNPSWQATPDEAREVIEKLAGLVRVDGAEPPRAVLGYRGFRLALGADPDRRRYEVGSGLVVAHPTAGTFAVLRDDGLEDLLLAHARRHGQDELLRALMK